MSVWRVPHSLYCPAVVAAAWMRQLDEGDADRVAEEARLQAEDADMGQDAEGRSR